ncbi:kynurenine---oxoglutarate transaminase [Strigomonas culicis]|uniref:Kynurenine---oxoglutarate transaminase n=1 Tax=Strigomonas culicis TaxID=28005 RepID=S9UDJ4_9TRYP|nr:kynurenine---oxoglutarate transaminase [Strigomonas culicis]|eukprot:EPY26809.1 kynurenine---oxoglutarate transaminase [Strigomonas culicis]
MSSKVVSADRLSTLQTASIWELMTPLANQHKAVNLGQGFPNLAPPPILLNELKKIVETTTENPLYHQYAPVRGSPELVNALITLYSKRFQRTIAPLDVLVTNGVTQGLNAVFQAFINEGDEVIFVEPFYDAYLPDVNTCGGVCKFVSLLPGDTSSEWTVAEQNFREAITEKTKFVVINTPQNIPGKAWSKQELEVIAKLAVEYDFVVVADEVYMNLIYDKEHFSIATLPGMWDRTITLCSAGKMFSCTGWKIGWVIAPPHLSGPITKVVCHQTFSISTPAQLSVARALSNPEVDAYFEQLRAEYRERLNFLTNALIECGLKPIAPDGGFFITADISSLDPKHFLDPADPAAKDWQFSLWLTKTIGVCALPLSAFCSEGSKPLYENHIRFAYCKTDKEIARSCCAPS